MIGYVYKCEIASKFYIGKTSGKPLARYKVHLYNAFIYKSNIPIARALRDVGEDDALDCFSVIEQIDKESWEELEIKLCERENYWMDVYNSIVPNGYNVNRSSPSKRTTNHKPQKPREKVMRKIICLDTNENFPSIATASRAYGISSTAICNCLKGKTNTASGLHWKYKDEEYHKSQLREGLKNHPSFSLKVVCKETGVQYPSASEAGRQTGICKAHILKSAKGEYLHAGGYSWGFVVDGKEIYPDRKNRNNTPIKCVETGEVFESITAAAKAISDCPRPSSLGSSLQRGHKYKGKTYVYIK